MEGHTVSQSRDRVVIPLASDKNFSLRYTTWRGFVRVGMLLEDLDTFAVWLAYRHNYLKIPTTESNPRPMTFVTAYVDRIRLEENYNISMGSDVVMDGYISWVGRSSIEISMHCSQETEDKGKFKFLSSKFVMVARNMDGTRSLKNIPLKVTNKDEERLFKEGEAAQRWRKLTEQQSLLRVSPNENEISVLHEFFKQTVDQREHVFRKRFLPPGCVWMRDARLDDTLLCFPIKRNIYGKIFGGFLMRKAVEVAWATAFMFRLKKQKQLPHLRYGRYCIPSKCGDWFVGSAQLPGRIGYESGSNSMMKAYSFESSTNWIRVHRWYSAPIVIFYVLLTTKVPKMLAGRRLIFARVLLRAWNTCFACIYATLFICLIPDFSLSLAHGGLYSSVCLAGMLYTDALSGRALFTFHVCKLFQLVESVLLMLTGARLRRSHVAHHAISYLLAVHSYPSGGAPVRWAALGNLGAQAFLYAYLASSSSKPTHRTGDTTDHGQQQKASNSSKDANLVSLVQLAQFPIGLLALLLATRYRAAGAHCDISVAYVWPVGITYALLGVLLTHFYVHKYCVQRRWSQQETRNCSSPSNKLLFLPRAENYAMQFLSPRHYQ